MIKPAFINEIPYHISIPFSQRLADRTVEYGAELSWHRRYITMITVRGGEEKVSYSDIGETDLAVTGRALCVCVPLRFQLAMVLP